MVCEAELPIQPMLGSVGEMHLQVPDTVMDYTVLICYLLFHPLVFPPLNKHHVSVCLSQYRHVFHVSFKFVSKTHKLSCLIQNAKKTFCIPLILRGLKAVSRMLSCVLIPVTIKLKYDELSGVIAC